MKRYRLLSQLPFLQSYASKFLFVAFVGTHIPMIGLAFYLIYTGAFQQRLPMFLIGVGLTLGTTVLTLLVLHRLLEPIRVAAEAQQLFGRYVRAKGVEDVDGKGIGLFLSRRMVEEQGGTLRAFSLGPGRGSTFTLELPQ